MRATFDAVRGAAMMDGVAGVWSAARRLAGPDPRVTRVTTEARDERLVPLRPVAGAPSRVARWPGRGFA